jgi:hypothetical protein
LRRGLAYEHCEKFKLAANDLTRVKQMDPMNKQARDSLTRCLKCIKQDEGIDYVPEGQDIEVNDEEVSADDVKITMTDQKPVETKVTEEKRTPQPDPVLEKKQVDIKSLIETLTQIKERGNQ